jgi:hypothetical protein
MKKVIGYVFSPMVIEKLKELGIHAIQSDLVFKGSAIEHFYALAKDDGTKFFFSIIEIHDEELYLSQQQNKELKVKVEEMDSSKQERLSSEDHCREMIESKTPMDKDWELYFQIRKPFSIYAIHLARSSAGFSNKHSQAWREVLWGKETILHLPTGPHCFDIFLSADPANN